MCSSRERQKGPGGGEQSLGGGSLACAIVGPGFHCRSDLENLSADVHGLSSNTSLPVGEMGMTVSLQWGVFEDSCGAGKRLAHWEATLGCVGQAMRLPGDFSVMLRGPIVV